MADDKGKKIKQDQTSDEAASMFDDALFRFPAFEAAIEEDEKNRPRDEAKQLLKKQHILEREAYKARLVKEVTANSGTFITKIEFTREFLAETVKESPYTFHFSQEASAVIESRLLPPSEVQAFRSKRLHTMTVPCIFSLMDPFVLQLKMDEKGCLGIQIEEIDWKLIKPQIAPSINPGMSIWGFSKPGRTVFMFWLPRWIADSVSKVKAVRKATAEPVKDQQSPKLPTSKSPKPPQSPKPPAAGEGSSSGTGRGGSA